MKIVDISWPISDASTEYKGRKTISFTPVKTFDKDGVRESSLCFNAHTGTHVDAAAHFLKDGKTIDEMHLDRLIGKAVLLDLLTIGDAITEDDLSGYEIEEGDIVLLRTANSAYESTDPFSKNFIYLDPSGAHYLAEKHIKAVGIDYLGIERGDPEHKTHITLMQADIAIIEGLRLGHVQAGTYFFICLPLAIIGAEAAPARAILLTAAP
jgi:arylformamidase